MKVVIIGATGIIGSAVATLLNDRGYEVVRVSRHSRPGVDITDPLSIRAFYTSIGEVDAVIYTAATPSSVDLSELTDEGVRLDLNGKLLGQVNLVIQGISSVRPGGVFILTGGTGFYDPLPKSAIIALTNGGLEGFVRGAAVDLKDARRIVLVHPPQVRESVVQKGRDGSPWPSAATVAGAYLMALESKITGQPVFVEGYGPS